MSQDFYHLKIDQIRVEMNDISLIPASWVKAWDTIFQCISDKIRSFMKQKSFPIINYIDDLIGYGLQPMVKLKKVFLSCVNSSQS